jgi:hypothetical protein
MKKLAGIVVVTFAVTFLLSTGAFAKEGRQPLKSPEAGREPSSLAREAGSPAGFSSFWPTLPEIRVYCTKKFGTNEKRVESCVMEALETRENPYLSQR